MKVKVIVEIDGERSEIEIKPMNDIDREVAQGLSTRSNPAQALVGEGWHVLRSFVINQR